MIFYASSPTPLVSSNWKKLNSSARLKKIKDVIKGTLFEEFVTPTRALDDGQIYFNQNQPIPVSSRGAFFLDLENLLKNSIDLGIVVWCEPIGDKNSLRNLRGIEIIVQG